MGRSVSLRPSREDQTEILGGVFVFLGLFLCLQFNFLLFHGLIELFSILVAYGIFLISWNTRRFQDNHFFLFLGIAYLFSASLDLVHTLAYDGMNAFPQYGANLPTQLWIAARYVESLSLLAAPLFFARKVPIKSVFTGYALIFSGLLASIFYIPIFPDCYIEGAGLTNFKIISEYLICLVLVGAAVHLLSHKRKFEKNVVQFLLVSLFFSILSELSFSFYVSVYGLSNAIGHFSKLLSFYLIYKVLIKTSLTQPTTFLFYELKKNREKFEAFFNEAPLPFYSLDARGCLLEVNPAWVEMLGYEPNEVLGKPIEQFLHPDSASNFDDCYCFFKEHGFLSNLRRTIRHKDGHDIEIMLACRASYSSEGLFKQSYCTFQDITQSLQDKKRLQESEMKFRLLAEHSHDWDYWLGPDGHYIYLSPSCETITGYNPDELMADPSLTTDMIRPDYAKAICSHFSGEESKTTQTYRKEFPIITKSGEERWIEHNCHTITDEHGHYAGKRGSNRDITERKRAEEIIHSILKAAPMVVGLVRNRTIAWISDSAVEMLGYTRDEMLGQRAKKFYANEEDFLRIGKRGYREAVDKGFSSTQVSWVRKDGTLLNVILSLSPLDTKDLARGLIFTLLDITELKTAEQKNTTYETRLQQTHKMEALGTLAGGIAHDFNNILMAIIGHSEIAKMKLPAGNEAASEIDKTITAGKRAADLVKQILTFSRKDSATKEPLEPHLILKEVLKMLRSTLPATINIVSDLDKESGSIQINATRLHQLVMNLCMNAAHAMDTEKGTIRVSLHRKNISPEEITEPYISPGPFIVLTVTDDGCGMDHETVERIFEPYFTTKEVEHGTGLGLALVHGIVKDINGFIRVESSPGKGSIFSVYLPAIENTGATINEMSGTQQTPKGTEHILLVDDEASILDTNRTLLETLGYRVSTEQNSLNALERFRTDPMKIDLLITDQTMPELTGLELAREIREIRPSFPVILCSGYTSKAPKGTPEKIGVSRFCLKPLDFNQLANVTREVLDEHNPVAKKLR